MTHLIGRILLIATAFASFAVNSVAQDRKPTTVGLLWFTNPSLAKPYDDAFRDGLRTLGYIDGRNITIFPRYAQGDDARTSQLLKELIDLHVDVLVVNPKAVRAAMQATKVIPIVCPTLGDPVKEGFIKDLARPVGNFTGISAQAWETDSKRLELAGKLIPNLRHVALLFDASSVGDVTAASELRSVARGRGITLRLLGVRTVEEISGALANIEKSEQALIIFDEPFTLLHREVIMRLAAHRLPVIGETKMWVEAGGVVAYAADAFENWRRSATYVDRILKGAKAGDLPIEQASKFELVVNLNAAKRFGIIVPQSILLRADEVIR